MCNKLDWPEKSGEAPGGSWCSARGESGRQKTWRYNERVAGASVVGCRARAVNREKGGKQGYENSMAWAT